ncbi:MAG: glycosyltransferase family 4 protein [Candidatus Methanomethylicaceae archaeon]
MNVLMLSWEYPPHIVGGLGRHVFHLSKFLSSRGVGVNVLTFTDGSSPSEEVDGNIRVKRINPYSLRYPDFISWIHGLNMLIVEEATKMVGFDLIHVHDWLTAISGVTLKHMMRKPLVATIHSTELGRRGNTLRNEHERHIHEIEWLLSYEAWRVICCSRYMMNEISKFLGCPTDKIVQIHNGYELSSFPEPARINRRDYARDDEKIVLFVGRLVYEKGPHLLLEAASKLRRSDLKFIFIGDGSMKPYLIDLSKKLGVAEKVYFLGHVTDEVLHAFYRLTSIAVFPSLYEPFGIAALEAMGAGGPVIVSAVGGLDEIVQDGYNGLKFHSGSSDSLAEAIARLIDDQTLSRRLAENARGFLKDFTWDKAAKETIKVYESVLSEYQIGSWKPRV